VIQTGQSGTGADAGTGLASLCRRAPAPGVPHAPARGSAVPEAAWRYHGVMTLTVHLDEPVAAALSAEAARRGQCPDQVAADLLAERLSAAPGSPRRLSFTAVLHSGEPDLAERAEQVLAERFRHPA
jgi:hypothetical protein